MLVKKVSSNNHQIFVGDQPYSTKVRGFFTSLQIFGPDQKVKGMNICVSNRSFLDPVVSKFGSVTEDVNCLRSGNILQIKIKDPLLVDRVKDLKGCENLEVNIELTGLWNIKNHGYWISWKLTNFTIIEDNECLF